MPDSDYADFFGLPPSVAVAILREWGQFDLDRGGWRETAREDHVTADGLR